MADEQKDLDTPGSDGFSAQNQQNDDSSIGNDGGENAETSPGSYRSRFVYDLKFELVVFNQFIQLSE